MTNLEFNNEFDILYNNAANAAPGLTEYEKSVFLTKAQDELLKDYFNPEGNKYKEGFDGNQKRQTDFSNLVTIAKPSLYISNSYSKFDSRSILYTYPSDVLFSLNETAICTIDSISKLINIVPIGFNEYSRLMSKPFKQPYKNQGWRLLQYFDNTKIAEVITRNSASLIDYTVRYIKKPTPIILVDLTNNYSGLSINNITVETECILDSILHPEILQRAVELAKAAYTGDIKDTVSLGQRSE